MPECPKTVVHVTHEAIEKMGGIGTVLEGLITSPVYQRAVKRSILVSPLFDRSPQASPMQRLGPRAVRCRYSGPDRHDPEGLGVLLRPIEWAFGTPIVFGTIRIHAEVDHGRDGESDVLLVDVSHPDERRLAEFKLLLHERYGLDSRLYEYSWDFEEYCRLAPPAYHALAALLSADDLPAALISHEFMGVCTALLAASETPAPGRRRRFRTFFHAHECSTARRIVEHHPGHDLAFYPAMRDAMARGQRVGDVFGDQSHYARHALVSRVHHLDGTLAVGDETATELRFLSHEFDNARVELCYNGVPASPLSIAEKKASRLRLDRWARAVFGFTPDYLFTHVARPVISKGLWRDLRVCSHMEAELRRRGKRALYLLLTCGATPRSEEDVNRMARDHGWPAEHAEGYPDITGPEGPLWRDIRAYNASAADRHGGAIRAAIVNQFGFSRERLGEAAPPDLSIADLRRAADLEFGQSTYEPFGIAHLEALHAGAISVPTAVCGCVGFLRRTMADAGLGEGESRCVVIADYTRGVPGDPLALTQRERDEHEDRVAERVAREILRRLPAGDADREAMLREGQTLALRMGWDRVCADFFLPMISTG